MSENHGGSFFTTEECRQCGIKPAVLLHYVWHKGQYLHICTACVLSQHRGFFCPICFTVYDDQYNLSNAHLKCSCCEAIYHLDCVRSSSSFFSILPATAASSSSSTTAHQNCRVVCSYCSNPNVKFFNFSRDERTNVVKIDRNLATQILAAATISDRSIKKAAKMASVRAQIMCKEAAEARKEANDALNKLHDLTFTPQVEDSESDYVSDHDDDTGDEPSDDNSM